LSIVAEDPDRLQNRPVSRISLAVPPAVAAAPGAPSAPAAEPWPLARLERWFLRGGAFLLPLAFSWDTYDGYVLPKLLLARLLIAGLAALWLARFAFTTRLVVRRSPLDLPLLAFLGSAALSTVFAYNRNVAVFGTYSRYDGLLTTLTYAAVFWLTVQTLTDAGDARALLRVLLAGGYLVAVVAIVQCLTDSLRAGELVPAFGTLGQKNTLGAYLAMLLPPACWEAAKARTWTARMLALNAVALIAVALFLTFSRSAWVAGAIGAAIPLAAAYRRNRERVAVAAVGAVLVLAGVYLSSAAPLQRTDLAQLGDRPVVYIDSLRLIASRPLLGYGPDNFGLVFPAFQSIDLQQPWDKAHAETLQVLATQGVLGLAAYAWLVIAFVAATWRHHRDPVAFAMLGGFAGYQLTLQVNFTALAAAFPYWLFVAGALVLVESAPVSYYALPRPRLLRTAAALSTALVAGFAAFAVVPAYIADTDLLAAVIYDFGGRAELAAAPARQAAALAPDDAVYATEVGNVAFEHGDWVAAAAAYADAARLGTFNAGVFRNLAIAEMNLGRTDAARAAAERAVYLDRFDPANQALLAQLRS
jgi:O-antigen ligase